MDKWKEARAKEHETMIESRQIALNLGLKMKIGDVEYQGDGNKAIFYYIADERVDFRQLIKVLAEKFRVRIEMKQIGARQEAGRIGGIGPCGRELCCATWMTNFVSVSTGAARFQDISLNPQKLAGQCAKLKCCLNYEVDQYVESLKKMPSKEISLHTQDNEYYFFKADILQHLITYSTDKHILANEKTISAKRAFDIIQLNKDGKKPVNLLEDGDVDEDNKSLDILDDSINRFDRKKKKKKKSGDNNAKANDNNKQQGDSQQSNQDPECQSNTPNNNQQTHKNNNAPRNNVKQPKDNNSGNNNPSRNNGDNRNGNNQRRDRDNRNRGNRDNRQKGNEPNDRNGNQNGNMPKREGQNNVNGKQSDSQK
jgi:cell fate regulator YaaT (PSP1 superfamily)